MKRFEELLFSDKGRAFINILFFLSLLLKKSGLIFAACAVWIVYLLLCIRRTDAKANRIVYMIMIGIAVVVIGVNAVHLL